MTEEAAIAVIDMYPTLLSLARAYALLVSADVREVIHMHIVNIILHDFTRMAALSGVKHVNNP